jgi:sulfite reductase (NADPH) hemoprotein beta-component
MDARFVRERVAEFRRQTQRRLAGELSEEQFRPLRLMNGLYLQRHAYMLRVAIPYGLMSRADAEARLHRAALRPRATATSRRGRTSSSTGRSWRRRRTSWAELAEVEMHAIQTSGNCMRNISSDQYAGVAPDEMLDPRPWCEIVRQYKTLHPEFIVPAAEVQDRGDRERADRAATSVSRHRVARRERDGEAGLRGHGRRRDGPDALHRHDDGRAFLPLLDDLLSYIEAILRVYNLHGRRDNKYKARIKILVHGHGGRGEFTSLVDGRVGAIRGRARSCRQELAGLTRHFEQPALRRAGEGARTRRTRAAQRDRDFADLGAHNVKPAQGGRLQRRQHLAEAASAGRRATRRRRSWTAWRTSDALQLRARAGDVQPEPGAFPWTSRTAHSRLFEG